MASNGYETNLSDTPLAQPNEELSTCSSECVTGESRVVSAEHEVLKATRARGVNNTAAGGILEEVARDRDQGRQ